MESALAELLTTALAGIPPAADEAALEELRLKYLGKKGSLTAVSAGMRDRRKNIPAQVPQNTSLAWPGARPKF